MLETSELAKLIDGPSVDREIDRLSNQGAAFLDLATTLVRRINKTVDWQPLGSSGARYALLAVRGEAVVFLDTILHDRVMKLRGLPENGFGAGFGCVIGRNKQGLIDFIPGTVEQALERERLTWESFEFGCTALDCVGEGSVISGLLLEQSYVLGESPKDAEIRAWMLARGWE